MAGELEDQLKVLQADLAEARAQLDRVQTDLGAWKGYLAELEHVREVLVEFKRGGGAIEVMIRPEGGSDSQGAGRLAEFLASTRTALSRFWWSRPHYSSAWSPSSPHDKHQSRMQ
jgi:phage shock protein A